MVRRRKSEVIHGSLQDQNVVVVGGSRGVGRSIVEAALREGATMLAAALVRTGSLVIATRLLTESCQEACFIDWSKARPGLQRPRNLSDEFRLSPHHHIGCPAPRALLR
ncbi:hypothetical protein FJ943_22505 [Mesorhizobium sp. B2-3-10]|nr:hypothetical protein FJ943_22505 [Mesorhizobium sp. B2-3-10]